MDTNQPTNPITKESLAEAQAILAANPAVQKAAAEIRNAALVGADFGAVEARVMAEAAEKPTRYVVPHNISEVDLERITEQIAKESKLPYEIVRAAVPEVAKEVPAILRSHQGWMQADKDRQIGRFNGQVQKALAIIKGAGRPVKLGFIEQQLNEPVFRALEPALNEHPNVRRKHHKNQLYYTWKD